MLSLSYMSSFFMSLGSFLEDCSFITFSNSLACLDVFSMIAYISLLRFFELVPMSAIMLASDKPKTRCVKCVPKCASVRVASSNIVY